jgi:DNA-binding transcriptional LysR family regulator
VLDSALARVAAEHPDSRVEARHLSSADQLAALRAGELDLGLLRDRPSGPEFAAQLVVRERLGVLLSAERAAELSAADGSGIRLEALSGLDWIGFPRAGSPAWYDELTAALRGHGISLGPEPPAGQLLIPEVKIAGVAAGRSFALAPPDWARPLPPNVVFAPLAGHPLVRRTWAVWPADARRRDLGTLVAALEEQCT